MNAALQKKVQARQKKIAAAAASWQIPDTHIQLFSDWLKELTDHVDGSVDLGIHADSAISAIPTGTHQAAVAAIFAGEATDADFFIAAQTTQSFLAHDLGMKISAAGLRAKAVIPHWKISPFALLLHAIGWHDEALDFMTRYWQQYPQMTSAAIEAPMPPNTRNVLAWFGSYFTLGSRDLIEPYGFEEPNDPDSPMSHLLGRWKEKDGDNLRNLLTAFAETNAARLLLPDRTREADYSEELMLFFPFDVQAIQKRRSALGLEPIACDDPRGDFAISGTRRLPLVQDDVLWPAYLRACETLGLTAYRPVNIVAARYDAASFRIIPA